MAASSPASDAMSSICSFERARACSYRRRGAPYRARRPPPPMAPWRGPVPGGRPAVAAQRSWLAGVVPHDGDAGEGPEVEAVTIVQRRHCARGEGLGLAVEPRAVGRALV